MRLLRLSTVFVAPVLTGLLSSLPHRPSVRCLSYPKQPYAQNRHEYSSVLRICGLPLPLSLSLSPCRVCVCVCLVSLCSYLIWLGVLSSVVSPDLQCVFMDSSFSRSFFFRTFFSSNVVRAPIVAHHGLVLLLRRHRLHRKKFRLFFALQRRPFNGGNTKNRDASLAVESLCSLVLQPNENPLFCFVFVSLSLLRLLPSFALLFFLWGFHGYSVSLSLHGFLSFSR